MCRETPQVEEAAAPAAGSGEAMDVMTALQLVLKKSLAHNGLARGLRETCKVCCASNPKGEQAAETRNGTLLPSAACFRGVLADTACALRGTVGD